MQELDLFSRLDDNYTESGYVQEPPIESQVQSVGPPDPVLGEKQMEESVVEQTAEIETKQEPQPQSQPRTQAKLQTSNVDDRERVRKVVTWSGLTVKEFAGRIDVLPATISHLLSGRNRPSLDVMRGILLSYPEIQPEWLILGKGQMLGEISDSQDPQQAAQSVPVSESSPVIRQSIPSLSTSAIPSAAPNAVDALHVALTSSAASTSSAPTPMSQNTSTASRHIERILILYSDGSYESR